MKLLHINATEDTPEINLNPESGVIEFSGISIPENAPIFYKPVIDWLEEYIKSPNKTTDFIFNIKMISSSSSKIFYDIITKIDQLSENKDVCIRVFWYYSIYDDEILEQGHEYKKMLSVYFDLILVEES
jgi:SiaC family regulatory phosphoprotein